MTRTSPTVALGIAAALLAAVAGAFPAVSIAQTPGSKPSTVTFPLEEDHFFTSQGAKLHGKLIAPARSGKFPAILYVTGGGDYSLMVDAYARNTVKAFTDAGIAVFMFDKRGFGKSQGSYPTDETDQRTADAIAAFDTMARLPLVDSDRLGVWALSQAGWFVPPVMSARPNADFLILLSPGGEPQIEWFSSYMKSELRKAGVAAGDLDAAAGLFLALIKYHGTGSGRAAAEAALASAQDKPWHALARKAPNWAGLPATPAELKTPEQLRADWVAKPQDYDWLRVAAHHRSYAADYAAIKQPVLLIYGDADTLVDPAKSASIFAEAWKGRREKTIVTFWDAGHGIQRRGNAENPMPEYLDMATMWAKRHFTTARPGAVATK